MEIRLFPVSKLEKKPMYNYHYGTYSLTLLKSVREQGILSPVWIVNQGGGYILDGHRRRKILNQSGLQTIPAILVREKDLQNAFISALNVNITQASLSLLEKLKAFWISKNCFSAGTTKKVSEILELDYIPRTLTIADWIFQAPAWLQNYVHKAKFSLKQLEKIQRYDRSDYVTWLKLSYQLSLNGFELIRILESIKDISQRQNLSVSDLWNLLNVNDLIEGNLTIPLKANHLKMRIEEKRSPLQHEINRKMANYKKKFPKSFLRHFEIDWDQNLEKQGIKVSFKIMDNSEIDESVKQLNDKNIRKKINSLVALMNQIPDKK